MIRAVALAWTGLSLGGCETLVSDAATRIRYELRDAAQALKSGREDSAVVVIRPRAFPDGCPSERRYAVRVVPYRGGKQVPVGDVFVKCVGGREYATGMPLAIEREMSVEKAAGEPVRVTLRKAGDDVAIAALE